MITLITGAPGSGKSLYTVDKLLRKLVGTTVTGEDDNGRTVVYDRVIYSNINGLLLDHQMVDADWLEHLPEHAKPGMVVVFDEVQRVWPNRPAGSKKSASVEFLETHRHEGIDLIILTQNPQLLDPAVRALVGRHLHMRRVGSFGGAIVYEWDATSNALNFKSAFTKTGYRYSRDAFKLYKSAKLHTKQTRSIPFVFYFIVVGLIGAVFAWPEIMARITGKADQMRLSSAPGAAASFPLSTAAQSVQPGQPQTPSLPPVSPLLPPGPLPGPSEPAFVPHYAGCVVVKSHCACFDTAGRPYNGDLGLCRGVRDGPPVKLTMGAPDTSPRPSYDLAADVAMIQAVTRRTPPPAIRF
jgi:zona occludens toxin